MSGIIHVFH
jgi:hypothetical protein